MDLGELNARWCEVGNPHAVPDPDNAELFRPYCPGCEHKGTPVPLVAAMSEVLAHKQHCRAVNSPVQD